MAEYIEREAAKKAFCEYCDWAEAGSEYCQSCPDPVGKIPAADVVPVRHGKWETAFLDNQYFGSRPYMHYCSVCNQMIAFRTFFCPNCGARMDGDGDV